MTVAANRIRMEWRCFYLGRQRRQAWALAATIVTTNARPGMRGGQHAPVATILRLPPGPTAIYVAESRGSGSAGPGGEANPQASAKTGAPPTGFAVAEQHGVRTPGHPGGAYRRRRSYQGEACGSKKQRRNST